MKEITKKAVKINQRKVEFSTSLEESKWQKVSNFMSENGASCDEKEFNALNTDETCSIESIGVHKIKKHYKSCKVTAKKQLKKILEKADYDKFGHVLLLSDNYPIKIAYSG